MERISEYFNRVIISLLILFWFIGAIFNDNVIKYALNSYEKLHVHFMISAILLILLTVVTLILKIKKNINSNLILSKIVVLISLAVFLILDIPKMWPKDFSAFSRLPDNNIKSLPISPMLESMRRCIIFYEFRSFLSGKTIKHQKPYPINPQFFSLARMKSETTNCKYIISDFEKFRSEYTFFEFPGKTHISYPDFVSGKYISIYKTTPTYYLLKTSSTQICNTYIMIPFEHNYYLIPESIYSSLSNK